MFIKHPLHSSLKYITFSERPKAASRPSFISITIFDKILNVTFYLNMKQCVIGKKGFPKIGTSRPTPSCRNLAQYKYIGRRLYVLGIYDYYFLVQFSPMKDLLIFPGVIFCQEKICSAKVKPRTMHTVPKSQSQKSCLQWRYLMGFCNHSKGI